MPNHEKIPGEKSPPSLEELKNIINLFRNPQKQSRIILEYLLPQQDISEERRNIPEQVFQLIANTCGLPCITKLDQKELSSWPDFNILKRLSMHNIEKIRTRANKYFSDEDKGWIELSLLAG